jgi:hypothetical protein
MASDIPASGEFIEGFGRIARIDKMQEWSDAFLFQNALD